MLYKHSCILTVDNVYQTDNYLANVFLTLYAYAAILFCIVILLGKHPRADKQTGKIT